MERRHHPWWEAQAQQLIATAADTAVRATRLERMLRQAMWRDTFLVYLPVVMKTRPDLDPEDGVRLARRAADAAAALVPPPASACEPATRVYGAQQEGTASRADEDEATRNA
jgi:hypothetical protein